MFLQQPLLARAFRASRHTCQPAFSYYQLVLGPSGVREGVVGLNDLPGRHAWISALGPVSSSLTNTPPRGTIYLWDIAEVEGARYNRVSNGACACRKPSEMRLARGRRPAGRWSTYNMAMVAQQRTRQTTAINHSVVSGVRRPDNGRSWVGRLDRIDR
jgi:hypothetical protein